MAPNIPTVDQRNGDGMSHYNALQIKVEKRFSYGLSFLASYTWSKTMDNTNVVYPWNDKLNYALSNGFKLVDVPQNFVFSYNYELPFGKGKGLLNQWSGVRGQLIGGWSINGITTIPVGPASQDDSSRQSTQQQRRGQSGQHHVFQRPDAKGS